MKELREVNISKWAWHVLLLVILIGHSIFKWGALPEMEVQGDEAFSIFFAQQNIPELLQTLNQEANPPLFFLILHFWIKLFGIDPVAVKSLIVLLSLGTAFFLFRIGKYSGSFMFTLFISAAFLFSNLYFDFSHEIRAFELVLLLTVASVDTFIRYIDSGKNKHLLLLLILTASLPYTHYNAVLVPVSLCFISIFYLFDERKKVLKLWGAWLVSGLVFLPQLLIFREVVPDEHFWLGTSDITDLSYVHFKLFGLDTYAYQLMVIYYVSPLLVLLFWKLGWLSEKFEKRRFLLFWILFALPLLINFLIAQKIPSFQLRYLLYAGLGIFLAIGYLLSHFKKLNELFTLVLLILSFWYYGEHSFVKRDGEGWKDNASLIQALKNDHTVVLVCASYKTRDLMYYMDREVFKDYTSFKKRCADLNIYPSYGVNGLAEIRNLEKVEKIILLLSHSENEDPDHLLEKQLNSKYNFCQEMGDSFRGRMRIYTTGDLPCSRLKQLGSIKGQQEIWGRWDKTTFFDEVSGMHVESFTMIPLSLKYELNEQIAFSPGIEKQTEDVLSVQSQVEFSCKEIPSSMLVVSVEMNGKSLKRAEYKLADYYKDGHGTMEIMSGIGSIYPRGSIVKMYIWNPGGPTVHIKEFRVNSVLRQKQD